MRRFLNDFFRYIIYRAGYRGLRRYFGWLGMIAIGIIGLLWTQGVSPQEAWLYVLENTMNAWQGLLNVWNHFLSLIV